MTDYGRLAYLKAEELEGRISSAPPMPETVKLSARIEQYLSEEAEIGGVYASGTVAAVFKLTLFCAARAEGTVKILADGRICASALVTAEGRVETVLLTSVRTEGERRFSVQGEGLSSVKLISADAVFVGVNASPASYASAVAAVSSAHTAVGAIFGGVAAVKRVYPESGSFSAETELGRAKAFDIKAVAGGFIAALCDRSGNLFGMELDPDLNIKRVTPLGDGGQSVAVHAGENRAVIAVVRGGKIFAASASLNLSGTGTFREVEFPSAVDRVSFSAEGAPAALAIESGGKCFLKLCEEEKSLRGTAFFKLEAIFI